VDLTWPKVAAALAAGDIKAIDAAPAPSRGVESGGASDPAVISIPDLSPISPGQPASGATQLILGPPADELWKVRCLRSIFTCDATPGDRVLVAALTSLVHGDVWSMSAGIVAQAGQIIEAAGGAGSPVGAVEQRSANGGEGLTSNLNITWPDVWIPADVSLRIWMFAGTGAGDAFSSANILVERRGL
jgi:hypothetical protein